MPSPNLGSGLVSGIGFPFLAFETSASDNFVCVKIACIAFVPVFEFNEISVKS